MSLPPPLPPTGTPKFSAPTRRPSTAVTASGLPARPPATRSGLPPRPGGLPRNRPGRTAIDQAAFGTKEVLPDPDWQVRTAPSDTPGGPWVTHYRIWRPGLYDSGLVSEPQIDLRFKSGYLDRFIVPHQVLVIAEGEPTGTWVHRVLLGPGWTPKNRQSRYRHFPI